MRLLKVDSFFSADRSLELQYSVKPPGPYAILSHTWGEDEVLFEDISKGTAPQRSAYKKLLFAAEQASRDKYEYLWVDTCCIDKSSSAELQEAINSMFRYYQESRVCYVYLNDVGFSSPVDSSEFEKEFTASRWFKRGWTLQELIASQRLAFFSRDWKLITDTIDWYRLMARQKMESKGWTVLLGRETLDELLRDTDLDVLDRVMSLVTIATGVSWRHLHATNGKPLSGVCIALKMSWASFRHTTREEDAAYCLLGLFDVSMPLLYGEGGHKAFTRLQEEIMKQSDDHSLFAWPGALKESPTDHYVHRGHGLLADQPSDFSDRSMAEALDAGSDAARGQRTWSDTDPYHLSSRGLQIRLPLQHIGGSIYRAILDCRVADTNDVPAILLEREDTNKPLFQRVLTGSLDLVSWPDTADPIAILVRQRSVHPDRHASLMYVQYSIQVSELTANSFAVAKVGRKNYWNESALNNSGGETWEALSKESFGNTYVDMQRQVLLLIEHTQSQQRLVVHFDLLENFFVGFFAYEISSGKDELQDTLRSGLWPLCSNPYIPYERDQTRLTPAGKTVVVETCNLAYHIKVEVPNHEIVDITADSGNIYHHFHLQLSIETSHVDPEKLAIDGRKDRSLAPSPSPSALQLQPDARVAKRSAKEQSTQGTRKRRERGKAKV